MNIIKSIFVLVAVISLAAISTKAYFVDHADVSSNVFSAGTWATPTPSPTPNNNTTICHLDNSGKYEELSLPDSALGAHEKHGDLIPAPVGGCPEGPVASPTLSPSISASPSPTQEVTPTPIE